MNEVEKLRVLIPHWIEHNQEHAAEFRHWVEQAGEAAPEILAAAGCTTDDAERGCGEPLVKLPGFSFFSLMLSFLVIFLLKALMLSIAVCFMDCSPAFEIVIDLFFQDYRPDLFDLAM